MLGDSSLASTGKVLTTAIKHGGALDLRIVFHVPLPGYLSHSVNRTHNIKRLFDNGGISWFGLAEFFIDEMGNKCKRSGAYSQQCKRCNDGNEMGQCWVIIEVLIHKTKFLFLSFFFWPNALSAPISWLTSRSLVHALHLIVWFDLFANISWLT